MKYFRYSFFILFLATSFIQGGDKTEVKWLALETALTEAKKSDKKLLLDFYTTWCGWCKRLDKDVYGNEEVAKYLNQEYVLVKINAEASNKVKYKDSTYTEIAFASSFGVTGYPTIVFLDAQGEPITSLGGYVPADRFLPIVKYIAEDHYKNLTWEEYLDKYVRKDTKDQPKKK
ncbi:MAG: DUF255 domain-containing protein [Ignavibacteriae bacterium]|nr:DUF255 domain-containing protein [Ignavibacteriota bacterium]